MIDIINKINIYVCEKKLYNYYRMDTYNLVLLYIICVFCIKVFLNIIDNNEFMTLISGALLYTLLMGAKVIYLKQPLLFDDVILTGLIFLSVGLFKSMVLKRLYPEADTNKDGLVTTQEFYIWKNKIENKLK